MLKRGCEIIILKNNPSPRMSRLVLLALLVFQTGTTSSIHYPSSPLNSFLPPLPSLYAINAGLSPEVNVSSADACASICLASGDRCVSFNLCQHKPAASHDTADSSSYSCLPNTFTASYRPSASADCSLYTKLRPRNDSKIVQAVPWSARTPPPRSVSLQGQVLGSTFDLHRDIYLAVRSPMDMLYWFFVRARQPPPPDAHCFGWGGWIKGIVQPPFII